MKKVLALCLTLVMLISVLGTVTVLAKGQQGQSGKSNSWHVNLYQKDSDTWEVVDGGAWGRLNCQIEDGMLTGVFNGKGLEPGVEYCLINYIEVAQNPWPAGGTAVVCLGSGTANKAGNVHIEAEGDIGEPDTMPDTGDYVGETGDKIWLVPCNDIVDGKIVAWNPDTYLFEDVLINTP